MEAPGDGLLPVPNIAGAKHSGWLHCAGAVLIELRGFGPIQTLKEITQYNKLAWPYARGRIPQNHLTCGTLSENHRISNKINYTLTLSHSKFSEFLESKFRTGKRATQREKALKKNACGRWNILIPFMGC